MLNDIFEEMKRLQKEINKTFGDFWESSSLKTLPESSGRKNGIIRRPLSDLEETEKEIITRFELPGVEKKNIQLHVTDNRIEVKVEREEKAKVGKKGFYRQERSYSGFYKSMILPAKVIPEKTKAKYKEGVLEVIMSKIESEKKNKIEIE